jgi:2-oxoisovalerate dehydrogenase E2 component (dihydrolipoyl transacylase)
MTRYVFKMPDLGEGTVEAEVVAWHVSVGEQVQEDQTMAEVMTEKAAVEVPAPVTGRVVSIVGKPGDVIPVGAELIVFDIESDEELLVEVPQPTDSEPAPVSETPGPTKPAAPVAAVAAPVVPVSAEGPDNDRGAPGGRVKASPAMRRRAKEAGIDLSRVEGSGPGGRITPRDFEAAIAGAKPAAAAASSSTAVRAPRLGVDEVKIIGVRRLIAQRMTDAKRNIPHFAYVEEIDVTELESLRIYLNSRQPEGASGMTYLPFLVAALTRVLEDFPQCNALHDAERGLLMRHRGVHVGIATQTRDGLKVPVVRHAESLGLQELAAEIRRVSQAARSNKAKREELTGSTITVTSLGRLGGIVSTPIINAPEMAIIGVNKAIDRPVVLNGAISVRRIMNLSSSFDHRFVDGFDAAAMIQALKEMLEHPATIFMPG